MANPKTEWLPIKTHDFKKYNRDELYDSLYTLRDKYPLKHLSELNSLLENVNEDKKHIVFFVFAEQIDALNPATADEWLLVLAQAPSFSFENLIKGHIEDPPFNELANLTILMQSLNKNKKYFLSVIFY